MHKARLGFLWKDDDLHPCKIFPLYPPSKDHKILLIRLYVTSLTERIYIRRYLQNISGDGSWRQRYYHRFLKIHNFQIIQVIPMKFHQKYLPCFLMNSFTACIGLTVILRDFVGDYFFHCQFRNLRYQISYKKR
jgi:hypothetical protein